jgi:hypothetical protein
MTDREAKPQKSALERFNACGAIEETDPLEQLRFFCSLAMNPEDWLDVEQFFDAVKAEHIAKQEPVLPDYLYGYDDAFDDFNEVPLEFDEVIKEYWSELRINEGDTFVMAGALSLGKCILKVVNNELIMVDCENKYYTSPQPAIYTDNSAVIAAMQAKMDKVIEALKELANYPKVEYDEDCQSWGNAGDTYSHGIDVAYGRCGEIARKALNELSQKKGE